MTNLAQEQSHANRMADTKNLKISTLIGNYIYSCIDPVISSIIKVQSYFTIKDKCHITNQCKSYISNIYNQFSTLYVYPCYQTSKNTVISNVIIVLSQLGTINQRCIDKLKLSTMSEQQDKIATDLSLRLENLDFEQIIQLGQSGNNMLHKAALENNIIFVEQVLTKYLSNSELAWKIMDQPNKEGLTFLDLAFHQKNYEILDLVASIFDNLGIVSENNLPKQFQGIMTPAQYDIIQFLYRDHHLGDIPNPFLIQNCHIPPDEYFIYHVSEFSNSKDINCPEYDINHLGNQDGVLSI